MLQGPGGLLNGLDDERHVDLRQHLRNGRVDFVVLGDFKIALAEIVHCGVSDGVPAGGGRHNDRVLPVGMKPEKPPLDGLAFPAWLLGHQRYRQ